MPARTRRVEARDASGKIVPPPASPPLVWHDSGRYFRRSQTTDDLFDSFRNLYLAVGPRAPNLNACAERWVQTPRRECRDHFLVLGERHLARLVKEFVAHYHEERPHQSRGNVPLCEADETEPRALKFPSGEVRCRQRLGGFLKHYHRAAA